MKFFDLFSGIGGFRLGLERAGFQCVGSCEIDKYAKQVYKSHWDEGEEIYPDARLLDTSKIPDFDILTAGFPCQAFSLAGKRMGFSDTRGTLFFEIARIAKDKRPRILFLENVKGLLYNDGGKTFWTIINTLDQLGYDVEWQLINGKHFLPQKRERIYIIGHARERPTPKIFPIREEEEENNVSCTQEAQTVNCIDANYWKGVDNHGQRTVIACKLKFMDSNIRNFETDVAYNIDTVNSYGIIQNEKLRMLTPLECERLQGFPDGWTAMLQDTQRYKCLGNAVMVPVVEYISRQISDGISS